MSPLLDLLVATTLFTSSLAIPALAASGLSGPFPGESLSGESGIDLLRFCRRRMRSQITIALIQRMAVPPAIPIPANMPAEGRSDSVEGFDTEALVSGAPLADVALVDRILLGSAVVAYVDETGMNAQVGRVPKSDGTL